MAPEITNKSANGCGSRLGNGCCPRTTSKYEYTLAELVTEFLELEDCGQCGEVTVYKNKPLQAAIIMAARADDGNGKLHSHQKWLWPKTAKEAEIILLKCVDEIAACKNFDVLHELIKSKLNIPGAGVMYWYDTAFRIGISLGVYPEKVYLHRGTRTGAENLGVSHGKDTLELSDLPKELRRLKPHQIEDFLCICKNELRTCKRE